MPLTGCSRRSPRARSTVSRLRKLMISGRRSIAAPFLCQRHALAGMPFDPTCEVELDQRELNGARRKSGEADDLVDLDRRRPQRLKDAGMSVEIARSVGIA